MLPWIVFSIILCVVGAVLTIIWWRVGDIWADEENKRFKTKERGEPGDGATIIRGFHQPTDRVGDSTPEP